MKRPRAKRQSRGTVSLLIKSRYLVDVEMTIAALPGNGIRAAKSSLDMDGVRIILIGRQ